MKLVRGEVVPEPAVHVGFMVVGDGGHDEKVMKALFKRFDDEKFVKVLSACKTRPRP